MAKINKIQNVKTNFTGIITKTTGGVAVEIVCYCGSGVLMVKPLDAQYQTTVLANDLIRPECELSEEYSTLQFAKSHN